jgi:hypothetical protein
MRSRCSLTEIALLADDAKSVVLEGRAQAKSRTYACVADVEAAFRHFDM